MALQELLRKTELDTDLDFLREGVRVMAQELMELDVAYPCALIVNRRTPAVLISRAATLASPWQSMAALPQAGNHRGTPSESIPVISSTATSGNSPALRKPRLALPSMAPSAWSLLNIHSKEISTKMILML